MKAVLPAAILRVAIAALAWTSAADAALKARLLRDIENAFTAFEAQMAGRTPPR